MDGSVVEALKRARAKIAANWDQGHQARCCSITALPSQERPAAVRVLCRVLNLEPIGLIEWNDADERVLGDVLNLYDRAIQFASRQEEQQNG